MGKLSRKGEKPYKCTFGEFSSFKKACWALGLPTGTKNCIFKVFENSPLDEQIDALNEEAKDVMPNGYLRICGRDYRNYEEVLTDFGAPLNLASKYFRKYRNNSIKDLVQFITDRRTEDNPIVYDSIQFRNPWEFCDYIGSDILWYDKIKSKEPDIGTVAMANKFAGNQRISRKIVTELGEFNSLHDMANRLGTTPLALKRILRENPGIGYSELAKKIVDQTGQVQCFIGNFSSYNKLCEYLNVSYNKWIRFKEVTPNPTANEFILSLAQGAVRLERLTGKNSTYNMGNGKSIEVDGVQYLSTTEFLEDIRKSRSWHTRVIKKYPSIKGRYDIIKLLAEDEIEVYGFGTYASLEDISRSFGATPSHIVEWLVANPGKTVEDYANFMYDNERIYTNRGEFDNQRHFARTLKIPFDDLKKFCGSNSRVPTSYDEIIDNMEKELCVWAKGHWYPSAEKLSEYFNQPPYSATVWLRANPGMGYDEYVDMCTKEMIKSDDLYSNDDSLAVQVVIDGKRKGFRDLSELSIYLGYTPGRVRQAKNAYPKLSLQNIVDMLVSKQIRYKGVRYRSVAEFERFIGVKSGGLRQWLDTHSRTELPALIDELLGDKEPHLDTKYGTFYTVQELADKLGCDEIEVSKALSGNRDKTTDEVIDMLENTLGKRAEISKRLYNRDLYRETRYMKHATEGEKSIIRGSNGKIYGSLSEKEKDLANLLKQKGTISIHDEVAVTAPETGDRIIDTKKEMDKEASKTEYRTRQELAEAFNLSLLKLLKLEVQHPDWEISRIHNALELQTRTLGAIEVPMELTYRGQSFATVRKFCAFYRIDPSVFRTIYNERTDLTFAEVLEFCL